MKIRKAHILARHFFNVKDNSAGIFFTEEDGEVDWLWRVIEETVNYNIRLPFFHIFLYLFTIHPISNQTGPVGLPLEGVGCAHARSEVPNNKFI
jgi:hypothetical protein